MNRSGFSLVELVVAMLILSTGLVALAGAGAAAKRSMVRAALIDRIARDAGALLDSLSRAAHPVAGSRANDGVTIRWLVQPDDAGTRIELEAVAFDGVRDIVLHFQAHHETE